jgi:hypothetical protein
MLCSLFQLEPRGTVWTQQLFLRTTTQFESTLKTNEFLRRGNRAGLLGRYDQTHHRMEPKQMAPNPIQKQQSYQQTPLRRLRPSQHQNQYCSYHPEEIGSDKHQQEGRHKINPPYRSPNRKSCRPPCMHCSSVGGCKATDAFG